jgi:hypothetical protein
MNLTPRVHQHAGQLHQTQIAFIDKTGRPYPDSATALQQKNKSRLALISFSSASGSPYFISWPNKPLHSVK